MVKRIMLALSAVALTAALIIFGADISDGIRCSLSVCGEVVIPSLFPFMVLANFIAAVGASDTVGRPLSHITSRVFALPKCTAAPILLSYISGYPVGASLAQRLHSEGRLCKSDAERMLTFTVNSSPAMSVFAVGVGMLGSKEYGILLCAVHIVASLLTGVIFCRVILRRKKPFQSEKAEISPQPRQNIADAFVNATADASSAMLKICGCVILFAGIVAAVDGIEFISPLLEVTVGCRYAAKHSLPLTAATLGFGGLSVLAQVLTMSKGLIRPHILLASRIAHAALSYLLCGAAIKLLPEAVIPVFSTGVPSFSSVTSLTAPVSAALMLLSAVVMWSAKSVKN